MSNLLEGKVFVKISELDATTTFDTNDEFVLVRNGVTVKTAGIDFVDTVVSIGNLATKSYTDAAVAALVAGAPGALDTLNELSAALNNDANFASTITNQLSLKLNVGDFGLYFWNELNAITTYHVAEGANLYYTEDRVDANFATKNTDALAEGVINLYYTDARVDANFATKNTDALNEGLSNLYHTATRARDSVFDNRDIIVFQNGGEVGNAQLQHQGLSGLGMDIYSPATHEWVQLNYDDRNYVWVTDSFAGVDVGTHTWRFNSDGTLTLAAGPTSSTHAATKGYVDTQISNIEIPVSLNDLTNVAISSPTSGQVLKYNGTNWVNSTDETGSGGGGVGPTPTFTTVTTTNLNVQNVTFTGTGAVTISSGNDLNLSAAGDVTVNGDPLVASATIDTTNASNITSGTLPNARLSAVPNSALANSSITVNGTSIGLGGTGSITWATLSNKNDLSGPTAIALGTNAGKISQGNNSVAIGYYAGEDTQGEYSVAIGHAAGENTQGDRAVAIGREAGENSQSNNAVAIGNLSGNTNQGDSAIAIGGGAGTNNQANNSIVINATGVALENTTANSLVIAPIRDTAATTKGLFYNTTTKEVTTATLATVAISGDYNDLTGRPTLATVATTGSYTDLINLPESVSVVRIQRTAGDTETTPGKWTFTTLKGSVTAEWVADGSAVTGLGLNSNPYIIWTFNGFTNFPSQGYFLNSATLGVFNFGSSTWTNKLAPNIFTSFDSNLHKYAVTEGRTFAVDEYVYIIK